MKERYLEELKRRSLKSRIYQKYQLVGLLIAEILQDEKHKALYMKLAKENDGERLIMLAKDVADRKNVKNKGAYFMKLLTTHDK
jgi:hypothetical protein